MSGPLLAWVLAAVVLGAALGALLVYAVVFSLRKNGEAQSIQVREDMKGQFASLAQQTLSAATEQLLKLAESRLQTEQVKGKAELDERRQAVENSVAQLSERLKNYEELMRAFEKDREKKYGSLEEQLRKTVHTTDKLQSTTEGLQSLLSNSRTRGQWGERMADDILRLCGMKEGVQYIRNRAQETASTRPDFTFLLPQDKKLNMDVKFPFDNFQRMMNAATDAERARAKAEFIKDARARIKEIQGRGYISEDEQTLDYVLLFIPNEQAYGFLQESEPGLIDEAIGQKVVLCSPFTLYAVLAVIRQAFENFRIAAETQEIAKAIKMFEQDWAKFKERFVKLGEQLGRTQDVYQEIVGASYKRLDQAIARVERLREGAADPPGLAGDPAPSFEVPAVHAALPPRSGN